VKEFLQKLGKSLMMPISIIAAAGIFLGLAAVLQNPNIVGDNFIQITLIQQFIGFVRRLVGALFGNLPILFAVSVAIGLAKDEKPTAAFGAIISFLLFHISIGYLLEQGGLTAATTSVAHLMDQGHSVLEATEIASRYETVLGIFTLRMNVFGGIVAGLWAAWMHNKFYKIVLPTAINFFGGKRFVPIIITVTIPFLSVLMYFVWPFVNGAIVAVGNGIASAGAIGTWIFGTTERLLIPTGLHHILNQLVRFTPVGGVAEVNGEQMVGGLNIFNALLGQAHPDMNLMRESTRFLAQGKVPVMMFGLPAACLAIYRAAKPSEKKRVGALLTAAALASFTTGITEPVEFLFIFISPFLFIFHAIMSGLAFFLMEILNVSIGNVQGGVIDLFVFGILQGMRTNWIWSVVVGLGFAGIYYSTFSWAIQKFDIKTPGRERESSEETVASTDLSENELGDTIVMALGGKDNIKEIDNCFTRLRLVLGQADLIDEKILKTTGAVGVVKLNDKNIQVIYGPKVEKIALDVKRSVQA